MPGMTAAAKTALPFFTMGLIVCVLSFSMSGWFVWVAFAGGLANVAIGLIAFVGIRRAETTQ